MESLTKYFIESGDGGKIILWEVSCDREQALGEFYTHHPKAYEITKERYDFLQKLNP